jgi:3-oxocholest-4-en-26-oyl-CoA dehydrogenase alpha subunit
MEFAFTKEQEKFRNDLREFFRQELTDEVKKEVDSVGTQFGTPKARLFAQKMGAKGWITPTWPKEYGGLASSEVNRFIVFNELGYAGGPENFIGALMAGPTIYKHGSEAHKKYFLPLIAKGEIEFALGYSEPEAGSDLGNLQMTAEDKGDHFLVNGQKVFNTHCHLADYHWLAARTDTTVPKHKGISLMIVDMKSPGITLRGMETMGGYRTNEVFYEDVKVPKENLVGELNQGWQYLMSALEYERMFRIGKYRRLWDEIVAFTKETKVNGKLICQDPLVRQKIAQIQMEVEISDLLFYWLAYLLDQGKAPAYESSMQKLFMTETTQHIADFGMQILGLYGPLVEDSNYAVLKGKMAKYAQRSVVETIFAGASEVQRDIIAARGLGLPRR